MGIMTLTELSKQWQKEKSPVEKKIKIGVRFGRSPISHHLSILLGRLNQSKRIRGFFLVKDEEYKKESQWHQQAATRSPMITYKDHETGLLSHFDMVLLPESNSDTYGEYPKDLIKIGLPHGVDIPFQKTIMDYGGGMIFDYVLSPIKESPRNDISVFEGLHHPEFRNHRHSHVCQIPFGFPKLDDFIDAVTQVKLSDLNSIVYHIAPLALEEEKSISLVETTLKNLLKNFPENRIIFRPYKGDYKHKVIKRCLDLGGEFNNFYLSTAESYVQDYSTARAMVCHRAYKAHLFSLATGRPIFLCHPDGSPTASPDPSVEPCAASNLVERLKPSMDQKETISLAQRVENCAKLGFHNPGHSVEYLVKNIDYILNEKQNKKWIYYPLDSKETSIDSHTYTALQVISAKPANMVFNAIAATNPSRHEILLFLADSYSRKSVLLDYYSKLSIEYFHRLITTKGLSPSLKATAGHWWAATGNRLLENIGSYDDNGPHESAQSTNAMNQGLLANRLLAIQDSQLPKRQMFQKHQTLIDLKTLRPVAYHGELSLYGARKLAGQFLAHKTTGIRIKMIADPDIQIIGTRLGTIPVQHPDALNTDETPILICSFAYVLESFLYLRKSLGAERRLFALCKDQQVLDFLDLLKKPDRPIQTPSHR